ncbi:hypothetical protein A4A31_10900 [Staphylococcus hominis]|nr:hypothetical protein A4A31_10900 [Staphylococcus hominis]
MEFSLKINKTFPSIIILIVLLCIFYFAIYYADSKLGHSEFFFFINKRSIQFVLAIIPVTLALLNIGFTLDQKDEEDKHNKKEIINCVEKHKNENKKSFSCEIDKEKLNKTSSSLNTLSIFNLLLTASFGILLIIHNLFKKNHDSIKEDEEIKEYIKRHIKREIAADQFTINNPYEDVEKYF